VANLVNGVTRHVTASAHRYDSPSPHFLIDVAATGNLTSSSAGPFDRRTLYVPAGYSDAGDPWVGTNPYDTGIAPRRIWATGMLFNRSGSLSVSPSQVRIWYTNDGGVTWGDGWVVDSRAAGEPLLDKPAFDVSWYGGTLGYLYVTYVEYTSTSQKILLRENRSGASPGKCRSVDPGGCIPPSFTGVEIAQTDTTGHPFAPQVVVNSNNGDIYVFWHVQSNPSEIRMRRAPAGTLTFGPVIKVADNFARTVTLANGLRSPSIMHARFNPSTGRVMLAWHGTDAGSQGTAIFFSTFDASALTTSSPVPPRVRIDAPNDQYQPAIDNDPFGNVLIAYYSNQNSSTNTQYQLWGTYVDGVGNVQTSSALDSQLNDPTNGATAVFIGDYHDNFYFGANDLHGPRWNTPWISFHQLEGELDTRVTGVQ
jgi:hypothetical protein